MQAAQAMISPPVHSFRLFRERLTQGSRSRQVPPDGLRPVYARIGQAIAPAAGKQELFGRLGDGIDHAVDVY